MPEKAAEPLERFEDMDLSKQMHKALLHANYETPTPVQAGVIPAALEGVDVIGQARTGTGKTASFVIPILEDLLPKREAADTQALILVPTRELAVQVRDEVVKLSSARRINCVALYGGKPIRGQIEKLKEGAPVVVGTPGRVLDHIGRGTFKLNDIWCVVLDEADRMLDIGFRPDIERILRKCPEDRQTLLLSATVPPPILRLAQRYMRDPVSLDFSIGDIAVETIEQFYFTVDQDRKFDLLVRLLERENPQQAIIFCRTKRGVDRLMRKLSRNDKDVGCIHGDLAQGARDRVMQQFRGRKLRILVATDVVGRGIDVSTISHIINFDLPAFCDDYVHRVGRTGRMGRDGVAYSFVCSDEGPQLTRIEERINLLLKRDEIEGFKGSAPIIEEVGEPKEKAPPPPASALKRRPKRYKRGL